MVIGKTASGWDRGGPPPSVTPLGLDESLPITLRLGRMLTCNTHSAVPGRVKKFTSLAFCLAFSIGRICALCMFSVNE